MRVGFVQFAPEFGEVQKNIDISVKLIESSDADLIVLPELCISGYNFTTNDEILTLSESIPDGPTFKAWSEVSAKKNCFIVGGIAEKSSDKKIYNTALFIRPDGSWETYRKVHLFFEEHKWFEPGERFTVFDIEDIKIGIMICFDWIFPEVSRTLALMGADIICHPSNLVLPFCQKAMITRCIENRVFAITTNRFGRENRGRNDLTFTGGSQIVDPNGNILASASDSEESVKIVDINPKDAHNKFVTKYNHVLNDRKPYTYSL